MLLALGIWRAPLLTLAYLYQTTLIAVNRESVGVRRCSRRRWASGPLVAVLRMLFGLPGAAVGVLLIGAGAGRWRDTVASPARGGSRPGIITWPARWRPRW